MTSPARTLLAFGAYLACVGLSFLLFPRPLLDLLGLPATDLAWVRLVGLLALYLALYDIAAARGDWRPFIRLSVPLRMSAPMVLLALVALSGAPRVLLLFGLVDLVAACWTWRALAGERSVRDGGAPTPSWGKHAFVRFTGLAQSGASPFRAPCPAPCPDHEETP